MTPGTKTCNWCAFMGRLCHDHQKAADDAARLVVEAKRAEKLAADVAWFQRTGHCGGCGQPAQFCLCTDRTPCGCRTLHTMGSGIAADPLDVFAAPEVPVDQQELFG